MSFTQNEVLHHHAETTDGVMASIHLWGSTQKNDDASVM